MVRHNELHIQEMPQVPASNSDFLKLLLLHLDALSFPFRTSTNFA